MSLFKLPLELREIIYELALLPSITVAPLEKVTKNHVDFQFGQYSSRLSIDVSDKIYLLSISRVIAAEVRKVMIRLIERTLHGLAFVQNLPKYIGEKTPLRSFEIVVALETDVEEVSLSHPHDLLVYFNWFKDKDGKSFNYMSTEMTAPPVSGILTIYMQSEFRTWTRSRIDYTFTALHMWSGGDILQAAVLGLDAKFKETGGWTFRLTAHR